MKKLKQTLTEAVTSHISAYVHDKRVIIGLSGGVDSMVLLHACSLANAHLKTKVNFIAVHVNHGINRDSGKWEEHCRISCLKYGIPFESKALSLSSDMPNLEAFAREARYQCFKECANDNTSAILLGHHQDDIVETFFLNLSRGSGINGLTSLRSVSKSHGMTKHRPFLNHSKSELFEYASEHGIEWMNDPSNESGAYDRNHLRNDIIPRIAERWPSFSRSVGNTVKHVTEDAILVSEIAREKMQEKLTLGNDFPLVLGDLESTAEKWRSRIIIEWLKENNVHYYRQTQVQELIDMSLRTSRSGADTVEIDGHIFKKCKKNIVLWQPECINAFLTKFLPSGGKEIAVSSVELPRMINKRLKAIAPQWAWRAIPSKIIGGILFSVGVDGKVSQIKLAGSCDSFSS